MIRFSQLALKIALLASTRNAEIWTEVAPGGAPATRKRSGPKAKNLDVAYNTLHRWLKIPYLQNKDCDVRSVRKIVDSVNAMLGSSRNNERGEWLQQGDFDNETSLREFADKLGLERQIANTIVDEYIYRMAPLFPAFYYLDEGHEAAADHLDDIKGAYDVIRYGTSNFNRTDVYVLKLIVRGFVSVGRTEKAKGRPAIRCKLTVPNPRAAETRPKSVEYDGFCCVLNEFVYWIFEARDDQVKMKDLILMITPRRRRGDVLLRGMYMTVNQDELGAPGEERKIAFRPIAMKPRNEREFATEEPRVITGGSIGRLEQDIRSAIGSPDDHATLAR